MSRRAITDGIKELSETEKTRPARIRRKGAGRKRTAEKDPSLIEDLDRLVDPLTRGDPESPLRWTCKSVRRLAEELQREGHAVSYQTVAELLHAMNYSLQANQKTLEGNQHADRNEQFEHINRKAQRYLKQGEPFRWTPRKRSWWEISRTEGASGNRRVNPRTFVFTTSRLTDQTKAR